MRASAPVGSFWIPKDVAAFIKNVHDKTGGKILVEYERGKDGALDWFVNGDPVNRAPKKMQPASRPRKAKAPVQEEAEERGFHECESCHC